MTRISMKDLEAGAAKLSKVTGQEFSIRNGYGQVGLDFMAQGGRVDRHETLLMTKGQLNIIITAMIRGAYAAKGEL